jgi:hypothetical protein
VCVSAWFWVLHLSIGLVLATKTRPIYLVIWFLSVFVSILIHEFGHVVAGRCFGVEGRIVLTALGGLAVFDSDLYDRWKRIVVSAAGPLAQLLFAGLLWLLWTCIPSPVPGDAASQIFPIAAILSMLMAVNVIWPLMNLIPVPPLDGGKIARELFQAVVSPKAPPWERDPDWWKHDVQRSDYDPMWDARHSVDGSSRLPRLILLMAAGLAVGWSILDSLTSATTATDLMREFKSDPQGALEKYRARTVTFKGVLKRPPWEKVIYQYEGGTGALVYFVTDNPGEWIFCITPHHEKLHELQEGTEYVVSGTVYHFESEGNLFLMGCSLRK